MSPPIIGPGKCFSASGTSIRPSPQMTILVSLQISQPRKRLVAQITLELGMVFRGVQRQPPELRRQVEFLGVVVLDVFFFVLVRREAEGD